MRVADIMQTKIQTARGKMSLTELERSLIEHRVSGFPVVDAGKLVGVVSRSDVVRALSVEHAYEEQLSEYYSALSQSRDLDAAQSVVEMGKRIGARFETMTVADVMVKKILTTSPDSPLVEVAKMLVEHRIHRLPVTREGELVGIVTSLDLVRLIGEERLVAA